MSTIQIIKGWPLVNSLFVMSATTVPLAPTDVVNHVVAEVHSGLGHIILNRPDSLNALSQRNVIYS
jgi:hypothetical protein